MTHEGWYAIKQSNQTNQIFPMWLCQYYCMDAPHGYPKKTLREKATWKLHKNAMSYLEQILEATPHKTMAVWPLTSHFKNHPSEINKTCGTLLEKQGQAHKWQSSTHGCTSVGQPARTYLHQLCVDPGCSLENLRAMDDRDGWRERVSEIHAVSTTWW